MLGQVQSLAVFQSSMKSVLCTIIWAAYRQDKVTEVDGSVSSRPALKTKWKRRVEQVQNWLKLLQWLPRNQKIGQMHRIQIFSQQPQCRVQVVLEVSQKFREKNREAFLKQNPGEAPLPTNGDDVFRAMDKQKGVSTTTRLRHVLRPFLTLADWGCIDEIYLDVHIYYLFIFRLWQLTVASHSYHSYFHPHESNFRQKITPHENTPKRKNNNTTAETNQQVTPRPHVPGKSMIPDHIAQRSKARRYKSTAPMDPSRPGRWFPSAHLGGKRFSHGLTNVEQHRYEGVAQGLGSSNCRVELPQQRKQFRDYRALF